MMLDARAHRAQELFWKIEAARAGGRGEDPQVVGWRVEMARLHEERGRELLTRGDGDGWIDLFAAVTAWKDAGNNSRARTLLDEGWEFLWELAGEARDNVEAQIARLQCWLDPAQPQAPRP